MEKEKGSSLGQWSTYGTTLKGIGVIIVSSPHSSYCVAAHAHTEGKMFTVTASMCEIYNERVYDLLDPVRR